MARSQVCSTSTNYVTLPSMWPPRGLNLPSCLKVKSYLCHPSKSCIYTTSYLRAIHTATKKHNIITYFGLLSFSIINRLKAILLSMDASYVNYLTVPLQRVLSSQLSSESLRRFTGASAFDSNLVCTAEPWILMFGIGSQKP